MDIEWAKDGVDGPLHRAGTAGDGRVAQRSATTLERTSSVARAVLAEGRAVGDRVATGPRRVIHGPEPAGGFRPGEVLVADTTTPDWEPVMKTAAAVVTDRGGRTCHAAIIARELGIPAVVGTGDATATLADGTP